MKIMNYAVIMEHSLCVHVCVEFVCTSYFINGTMRFS